MKEKETIWYSEVSFTDFINNSYFKLIWKLPVKKLLMENFSINFAAPKEFCREVYEKWANNFTDICVCAALYFIKQFLVAIPEKIDIFAHYIYK